MRRSKVLSKWRDGRFARFCATGHLLPFYISWAAHLGFDGIWLDLEHRTMDPREVQMFLHLCNLNDIDCMVRPGTREPSQLYHFLEDGAAGFMFPLVNTRDDACARVRAVRFPPLGQRGLDGAGLDGGYGVEAWRPGSSYVDDANRETFVLVQIETPEAVRNVEEIAAVPGIDGLFVGPGDLGLRLKAGGGSDGFDIEEAAARTQAAAQRHHIAWGITAGPVEDLTRYIRMGAQIIPRGGDFALVEVLKQTQDEFDGILGEGRPGTGLVPRGGER